MGGVDQGYRNKNSCAHAIASPFSPHRVWYALAARAQEEVPCIEGPPSLGEDAGCAADDPAI